MEDQDDCERHPQPSLPNLTATSWDGPGSTVVSWVDSMIGEMADCWAGMMVAMRVGSMVVSWVDLMVGELVDCWAWRMAVMTIGSRAG